MPGSKKVGKERLDKFYYMAKEQGYRARSAFKLVQLNKKYDFLSRARCVIDLCAAPGGWCQVAAKNMPKGGKIVGIDLFPIKQIPGVDTIVADITTVKCRNELKKIIGDWKANVVLHDGAPNVGQAWNQDAFTQAELVLASLKLATEFLKEGGTFVTKVFRSSEYNSLMWVLKQLFKHVEATKPEASRNQSAEIFVVCQNYLDPKKIDPKMLNPKYVFSDISFPTKTVNPLSKKEKVNRGGYDEGQMIVERKRPIHTFITGTDPLTDLGTATSFTFDSEEDQEIKNHPATNAEILALCSDLRVLGKLDFKRLLKWRLAILKSQKEVEVEEVQVEKSAEELYNEEQEDLERRVLENHRTKLKAEKKRLAREHNKKQRAIDLKISIPGLVAMDDNDLEYFKLNQVKDDSQLDALLDAETPDDLAESDEEDESTGNVAIVEDYDEFLEQFLDNIAEQKMDQRLSKKKKAELVKQQSLTRRQKQIEEDGKIFDDLTNQYIPVVPYKPKVDSNPEDIVNAEAEEYETDEDEDEDDDEMADYQEVEIQDENQDEVQVESQVETKKKNSLLFSGVDDESSSKTANLWFSQFGNSIQDEDDNFQLEKLKSRLEKRKAQKGAEKKRMKKEESEWVDPSDMIDDDDSFDTSNMKIESDSEEEEPDQGISSDADIEDEEITAIRQMMKNKTERNKKEAQKAKKNKQTKQKKSKEEQDSEIEAPEEEEVEDEEARILKRQRRIEASTFEVVPQVQVEDEEDLMEGLDMEEKAKALSIGTMIIRDPKVKQQMIDAAYHRFAYNDQDDMPTWFAHDERENTQRRLPMTKEIVMEMKKKQRELDARPIKKVMEAKARKKVKQQKVMNSITREANVIVDQEGLTPGQKSREIEKLYKRKLKRKQPKVITVLNGKSGAKNRVVTGKSGKGVTKVVDRRMKKEMRSQKAREKSGGKRKR